MEELGYIKGRGIWYPSELNIIKKKDDTPLQAIFEAFTNALESIATFQINLKSKDKGCISINLFFTNNLLSGENKLYDFQKIEIADSGIGFNDNEYNRFLNLRDDRKHFSNKGTGRVQFIHTFNETKIESTYIDKNSSTGFKERKITLSKSDAFINNNAIIRLDDEKEVASDIPKTTIVFETLLQSKDIEYYNSLTTVEIKKQLIRHYLIRFCENRKNLPQIKIRTIINNELKLELEIISEDIPVPNQEKPIEIYYSRIINNTIETTINKEIFNLKSFIIKQEELDKNQLMLTSKGEIAKDIKLDNLLPFDVIDGSRYLFLLSSNFIDERDSDNTRGEINILKKKEFKKLNSNSLFETEEILLEDIEDKTNQTILSLYTEIEQKHKEKEKSIEELQEMFLLNPKTLKLLQNKIHIGDTDDTILRKVYEAESKNIADKDAELKKQIKDLEALDSSKSDYQEKLTERVNEFVKAIPLQNRTALTQYIARRKMVLELFDKILKKEIAKLQKGGRIDEDLMHNLIFQQSSECPENSDLWLIADEFIYFNGFSEKRLEQIKLDGEKIFNKSFTEEEKRYLNSLGEKRLSKRPDILLFPDEGKCIIIEFKAPNVNVSEHLHQIDTYASLIRNYTVDKFNITTFYGYLIGESIEDRDVRTIVGTWEHSYHLDFWFRPSVKITGFDGRKEGNLYTEVIKYTTLLERAKLRNRIFIDKLIGEN